MYNMDRKELMEFHTALSEESRGLMVKKNSDYADDTSVFGNLDLIEALFCGSGRTTEEGIVIRLGDKLARLAKSTQRELQVTDESVRDTVKDMINYAVLFLAKKHERMQNATMAERYGEPEWTGPDGETLDELMCKPPLDQEYMATFTQQLKDSVAATAPVFPHRVYIAGPFSNGDTLLTRERDQNTEVAANFGQRIAERGHLVLIPHAATAPLIGVMSYEKIMQLDFTYMQHWATALFRIPGESAGADREVARAKELGYPVWFSIDDVPEVKACALGSTNASGT